VLYKLQDILPHHRVKGFLHIELEQNGGLLLPMEPSCIVAQKHEVDMDVCLFNKGTLDDQNKMVHVRNEPQG
jgi:hypothetical protein